MIKGILFFIAGILATIAFNSYSENGIDNLQETLLKASKEQIEKVCNKIQ
jgi:hypothetical protein